MPNQRINPEGMVKPTGYTYAVKSGKTVYVSGQVAQDAGGNVVGKGNAGQQAEQVFKNLELCLKAAGGSMKDIVKITSYLTTADDIPAFRQVRVKYLADGHMGSTLVVVSRLASPDFIVEVEAIAVLE